MWFIDSGIRDGDDGGEVCDSENEEGVCGRISESKDNV
jgi:hypothetical protein